MLLTPKTYRLHPREHAWLARQATKQGYSVAYILRQLIRQAMTTRRL